MFRLIVPFASWVRARLRHAPSNRLLRRLHARHGAASAAMAMLAAVAFLFAAAVCTVLLERGAPGTLNVAVVLFLYNGVKLTLHGLGMTVALARDALRNARRRRAQAPQVIAGQASDPPHLR